MISLTYLKSLLIPTQDTTLLSTLPIKIEFLKNTKSKAVTDEIHEISK